MDRKPAEIINDLIGALFERAHRELGIPMDTDTEEVQVNNYTPYKCLDLVAEAKQMMENTSPF